MKNRTILLVVLVISGFFTQCSIFGNEDDFNCYMTAEVDGVDLTFDEVRYSYYTNDLLSFVGQFQPSNTNIVTYSGSLYFALDFRLDSVRNEFSLSNQNYIQENPQSEQKFIRFSENQSDVFVSSYVALLETFSCYVTLFDTQNNILELTFSSDFIVERSNGTTERSDTVSVRNGSLRTKLFHASKLGEDGIFKKCR